MVCCSVLTASCEQPGVCEAPCAAEEAGLGMCRQGELSAVWRITLVAMALQGAGGGGGVGAAGEAMPGLWTWTWAWTWSLVPQAPLELGRVTEEAALWRAVLLLEEVSVKLGL